MGVKPRNQKHTASTKVPCVNNFANPPRINQQLEKLALRNFLTRVGTPTFSEIQGISITSLILLN